MHLTLIAAMDRNRAIGQGNALPWHLPDDLKRFKRLTTGKPILMGRKTAESLGRALPGRLNVVLSRSGVAPFEGMHVVRTLDDARRLAAEAGMGDELMVIGGGEIYALCLAQARRMHLTLVDTEVAEADAFFPPWHEADWIVAEEASHAADARHAWAFRFLDMERR
ncbi:MAG: dihydrofolate reductase [Xanthomonadales bacterium]|nr:dihydrofolate reductase [Xanthomonadales bacterium]